MGISMAYPYPGVGLVSHYMPFRHNNGTNLERKWLDAVREVLLFRDENKLPTIWHNMKFDHESLHTIGIEVSGLYDICTMLVSHLLNENLYVQSLDALTKQFLGDPGKKISPEFKRWIEKHGWGSVPSMEMYEYASYDVDLLYRLWQHLKPQFEKEGLRNYWFDRKVHTVKLVREMERRGVAVDTALCEKMQFIGQQQMTDIVEILDANPASPKDLKKLLIDGLGLPVVKKTPTGAACFDKQAMVEYEEMLERLDNDTAKLVLAFRGWQKSTSSNYKPYIELLSPDGRLRPNYKLHGTKTGRWSCEKPNLQQIPRVSDKPWNGEMKSAFIARPGFSLWEADYGQLELRLATAYAEEESLLQVFAEGRDIFTEMAQSTGLARHDQKTLVYTIQYGGGIRRISNVFGVDSHKAEQLRYAFYSAYPGFRAMSELASRTARTKKRVKIWTGRYRHFRFPQEEAHKAFNSVIQGGAADIVEGTMQRLFSGVDTPGECEMLLQVHDSVVFEIRDDLVEQYKPRIIEVMENVEPDFGVKFSVDFHQWGK